MALNTGCRWQIILQAPNAALWSVTVADSGLLQSTLIAAGTPETIQFADNETAATWWQLGVNNFGLLQTTSIAQPASFYKFLYLVSGNASKVFNLSVDHYGVLHANWTHKTAPLNLTMDQIRAFPSSELVDLVGNPQFSICTRQAAANHLVYRQAAFFASWSNYFLGYSGPAPTDPINGMIINRSAEDPDFKLFILNAVPVP